MATFYELHQIVRIVISSSLLLKVCVNNKTYINLSLLNHRNFYKELLNVTRYNISFLNTVINNLDILNLVDIRRYTFLQFVKYKTNSIQNNIKFYFDL